MLQVKRFSGVLNTDDKNSDVLPGQHISAKNIRFTGGQNGLTIENVKGNTYVINSELPAGTNECIGAFFDQVKQRIIWFNYNSNGNNGIYAYYIQTSSVSKIFLCGTDSATDILNFSLNFPVHSAAFVYRTEGDGDLLYWTDGNNPPRYLNVDTVSTLAPFDEAMIDAAKNAPQTPPFMVYADDTDVTVNNLRKKMVRACYRWVYKNGEKSTFSPISKVPLPVNGYDPDTSNDPTLNNNIIVTVWGGGEDYQAIELACQFNINNAWGDFFLVDRLDRDQYNIPAETAYNYYFYNDGVYTNISTEETDLPFSWLPNKANTLELLNGNVIVYGGITDGYNQLTREEVDVTVTAALGNPNIPTISFNYSGLNQITVIIGSVIQTGATYSIFFNYSSGAGGDASPKNVSYTTLITDTLSDVVAALIALLNGNNISATSLGSGVIRIVTTTGLGTISGVVVGVSVAGSEVASSSWKWNCPERLGLVYFDEKGKTNGVISYVSDDALDTTDFAVTTPDFGTQAGVNQVPVLSATINHTPPDYAVSYQWVRANLLPTNFLYWVTNDYQSDTDFLYFCIQNLYYTKTKTSGFVPSYEFKEGDRVRVIASFSAGSFNVYNIQMDMEILGVTDRTMNSPASTGTFLKVAKPTTVPSTPLTAKMLVEIYTPKEKSGEDEIVFYEWGEKYDIYELQDKKILTYSLTSGIFQVGETITQTGGGAGIGVVSAASSTLITVVVSSGTFGAGYLITGGTSLATGIVTNVANGPVSRYHRGGESNQTGLQPATFQWFDGDVYYRNRNWYEDVSGTTTTDEFLMDANYSDYFTSAVNSNGRPWIIDYNAREEYNSVLVRWGGKYQSGTNINQLSIFRPNDYDEVDRSKGDIRRFKVRDRILRVFQDRGVGQYGIYSRFIQSNDGTSSLVTTNEIITTNNIQYYQGVFGLCGYPTNLSSTTNADYFIDVVTGRAVRLSGDGLTDLGLIYKGQFYLSSLATPYNKTILQPDTSIAKILGFFDTFDNQNHFILEGNKSTLVYSEDNQQTEYRFYINGVANQGDIINIYMSDTFGRTQNVSYTTQTGDTGIDIILELVDLINVTDPPIPYVASYVNNSGNPYLKVVSSYDRVSINGEATVTISSYQPAQNFSFNETRNGFTSFYDYHPEWGICANDLIFTWKEGGLWKHDSTTYCNFYGTQYNAEIEVVFNDNLLEKKSWNAISELASDVWDCPSIYSNVQTYANQRQETTLTAPEFKVLEGMPSTTIKRDVNSPGGKWNGDFIKGNWLAVKFRKENAQNLITLSELSMRVTDSPRTDR